jgi:hypothetical protein
MPNFAALIPKRRGRRKKRRRITCSRGLQKGESRICRTIVSAKGDSGDLFFSVYCIRVS